MAKAAKSKKPKEPPPEPRFRTRAEKETLRVLWSHRDEKSGLVRSQVHKRMTLPPKERPTPARIGQILHALYHHGYLDQELDKFQGRSKAAFFRLNTKGVAACQEHYSFERQERVFFQTTEEMRQKYLTAKYFDGSPDAPVRRIIGFYACRGGIGQSALVAHTGHGLALEATRKQILVVDFDTSAPGLDRFFIRDGGRAGRGLRGLIVDFHSQPDWAKERWLRAAVEEGIFFTQPRPKEAPGLHYLSSGMGEVGDEAVNLERAMALELLRAEVGGPTVAGRKGDSNGATAFLTVFREALLERFDLVLVDSHAGRNSTVLALSEMADQWVVSARPSESPQTLESLRSVLAWHFRRQEEKKRPQAGLFFVLHLSGYGGRFDGSGWIREQLLKNQEVSTATEQRLWLLRHEARLQENATDWRLTSAYASLVKRLVGIHASRDYLPPEQIAITKVLDPQATLDDRRMWAGGLMDAPLANFARHLEALFQQDPSVLATDQMGRELLEEIFDEQCRKTVDQLEY